MQVRVKESLVENFYGYYGIKRRYPGDEFTLVARKDKGGKTISAASQFSSKWMEKVGKDKLKPKEEEPQEEESQDTSQTTLLS